MAVWFITRCLHMGMHPSHRIRLGAPGWVWHLLAIEVNSVSGALVVFGGCHAVRSKSTWWNTSRIFHFCRWTIQTTGDFKHAQPVLVWFVVAMEKNQIELVGSLLHQFVPVKFCTRKNPPWNPGPNVCAIHPVPCHAPGVPGKAADVFCGLMYKLGTCRTRGCVFLGSPNFLGVSKYWIHI